jgi:hypothetical protein
MERESLHNIKPQSPPKSREQAEHDLHQSGAPNGMERLKKGRNQAVLYRCTQARKDMLHRLALALSTSESPTSYIDTINAALDALDEKLRNRNAATKP